MVHPPPDFMPLDPGRIHANDPMEIAYGSMQFGSRTAVFSQPVARHGEHVTVVGDALPKQSPHASEDAPNDAPDRTTRGRRWPIQPLPAMVCRAPRKPAARATPLDLEMHR
jgi:hypothetical protein